VADIFSRPLLWWATLVLAAAVVFFSASERSTKQTVLFTMLPFTETELAKARADANNAKGQKKVWVRIAGPSSRLRRWRKPTCKLGDGSNTNVVRGTRKVAPSFREP
jgi:hypothetical protein